MSSGQTEATITNIAAYRSALERSESYPDYPKKVAGRTGPAGCTLIQGICNTPEEYEAFVSNHKHVEACGYLSGIIVG